MPAPFTRRLAGLRFVTQPPQLLERLPRMDIAVFVGFASAGPLQLPVVVEDAAQFAAIFGDDLPLAWNAEKGVWTFACLAPAVRAFFRDGGRRCWVIRVADKPEIDLFPLPGLARVDGVNLHPAFAQARSPGSWFDAFRASTALAARAIEVLEWAPNSKIIQVLLSRENGLRAGDLLRLRFTATRQEAFFVVKSVKPMEASPPDPRRGRTGVEVELLGTLRLETAEEISTHSGSFHVTWEGAKKAPDNADGTLNYTPTSPPTPDEDRTVLDVSAGFAPPPGTLLTLDSTTGRRLWFQVEESELAAEAGSPPSGTARITGRAFSWSDQPPSPVSSHPAAERLTFELRVRRGDSHTVRLVDLDFAPTPLQTEATAPPPDGAPRFWNALPNDAQLFASTRDDAYESLWLEAEELRFPLAGDYALKSRFIPVGMSTLAEPVMAAQNSGRSALERDGLEKFSSSLFLDPSLLGSGVSTLTADSDFIRYQMPGARRLRGIHAAFEIEEASLIAVPDAIQRGWERAEPSTERPPLPSEPRPHPSWWSFLCAPPESPPAGLTEPSYGHFLKCDLVHLYLRPPTLAVEGPDAGGAFTLNWSHANPGVEFILEEASEPDFENSDPIWRGDRTSYTILSRPAGIYYYRVRAEAKGESSDWSDGVRVPISAGTSWQLERVDAFQPDTLLQIHRALLRFCAARGDIMAVLALPEHFREDDALAYLGDLKNPRTPANDGQVRPLGTGEAGAFSYAAIYHPWLVVREEVGGLRRTPPDGPASGLIAARSLTRGAWIAPANEIFTGAVSLTPRLGPERYLDLLLAQLNLIRQEPRGFLALSADTLSVEEELRPINVRRLLILLRRAALRLGMTFVFEPNDRSLRQVVQGAFESFMQQLFVRGAFAGATPDDSYRVVTDETLNTPQDFDQGRFRVDLKVAPALPMSFLTVRLVQMGERATATELI